jgi:rod shape determining protein RodA
MRFKNIFYLNYLFIFVIILLVVTGIAALYSAADGNFYPWSAKHLYRFCFLFIGMITIALIDIKLIFKYSYLYLAHLAKVQRDGLKYLA